MVVADQLLQVRGTDQMHDLANSYRHNQKPRGNNRSVMSLAIKVSATRKTREKPNLLPRLMSGQYPLWTAADDRVTRGYL